MPGQLFATAEKEEILVDYCDLPLDVLGAYYNAEGKPPVILLHEKIRHRRTLLRCVLAEELGHHFTTPCDLLLLAREKHLVYYKYEKLALLWAAQKLIPPDSLRTAMQEEYFLEHEMAEYFDVTHRFLHTALTLYLQKGLI